MSARPYKDQSSELPDGVNKIATHRWVMRLVRRVLKKLHFTGDGIQISESAEGQVHFKLSADLGGAGIHPFKVELSTNPTTGAAALKIHPGICVEYGRDSSGAWLHTTHAPTVGGTALTTPLYLAVAARVILTVKMSGSTGNAITPFAIISTNGNPTAVPLIRGYGSVSPQSSEHGIVIAEHNAGVITQIVTNNVRVSSHWNQVVASF
jgi:hypothetical protein